MKDQDKYKKHSDLVWVIANLLRGPYHPPQYRRVMIPLTVLRRLDCVLEASKKDVLALHESLLNEDKHTDETIEKIINQKIKLSFHNISKFTFATLLGDPDKLAVNLRQYMAGFSTRARKIIDKFNFDEEIEKLDEANRLYEVVHEIAGVDLHPDRIPNRAMGYIFEDLVRRFNEQANEEAGDHFTPREVVKLMVNLLLTNEEQIYTEGKVIKIYDPACGTGGILSEAEKTILEQNEQANVELFGQEYNPESYAICGSDLMIKGEEVKNIIYGDTLGTGKEKEGQVDGDGKEKEEQVDGDGHPTEQFHYMAANPPFGVEWKPEKDHVTKEHNEFGFAGRFGPGLPRINDGALLFLLHMINKMRRPPAAYQLPEPGGIEGGEGARIAIIFNGSPLFTGDAGGGESNIRRWIIENDMLEAIVGMPNQLFYNTGIFTYIWIVTNRKIPERQGKIQLINATDYAWKMKKSLGDKRKRIGAGPNDNDPNEPDHISDITNIYAAFKHDEQRTLQEIQTNVEPDRDQEKPIFVSKIFYNQDFGYLKMVVERPLRLNFIIDDERIGRVIKAKFFEAYAISKKRKDKAQKLKEFAAGKKKQAELLRVLEKLKPVFADGVLVKDRAIFIDTLKTVFKTSPIKFDAILRKALLAPGVLAEKDPTAEPCLNAKGTPEPDPDLKDTENVPLPGALLANGKRDEENQLLDLPLPLDYESKETKGKVDNSALLDLVKEHCQAYLEKEVLPHRSDAWIDHTKLKVGYEIPFNRHFYQYEPPRDLVDIEADIKGLEAEIMDMLKEVV